jgi:hypothetical protein
MKSWQPLEPESIFEACTVKYGNNFRLGNQISMCLRWMKDGALGGITAEQLDAIEHHRRRFFPREQPTWELHAPRIDTMFRPVDPLVHIAIVESRVARGTTFQGIIPTHRMALHYELAMHAMKNMTKDDKTAPHDVLDYPHDDLDEQLELVGRLYNAIVNEHGTYDGCEGRERWPLKNRTMVDVELICHKLLVSETESCGRSQSIIRTFVTNFYTQRSILIAETGLNRLYGWFHTKGVIFEECDSFEYRFRTIERNLHVSGRAYLTLLSVVLTV